MKSRDRRLGMDRAISRRDFLNGVSVAVGASLLPGCSGGLESAVDQPAVYYPPTATGMRGSHPGSFEIAHAAVQGRRWDAEKIDEAYDLVVVGAGISGLSAAYIYHRDVDPNARILILDNHDDFGGHAKRNEFTIDGRTLVAFGGTMNISSPRTYPAISMQVIQEIGIDPDKYGDYYHRDLFRSLELGSGTYFDKETFGVDHLARNGASFTETIKNAPLSDTAKAQLAKLYANETDYLAGMTTAERLEVLESYSWRDYLKTFAGLGDEALLFMQKKPEGTWGIGADALPAWMAMEENYLGFGGMDLGREDEGGGQGYGGSVHFPDGNATVARSLVRKLIPEIAPGNSMEDVVAAQFDYARLDEKENLTRIRLSSTVVDLRHQDDGVDGDVNVSYVKDGKARTVTASKVVWAGYHAMLPYVCPDVPEKQMDAQRASVRSPLVYTSVLIRNWNSFVNLGVSRVSCPGSFFHSVRVNRPVSMGDYRYPQSPDEPNTLHLQHIPLEPGLSAPEQFRAGRRKLLEMSFETFEHNIRDQLGRMLGPGGFDSARDIAGITVNRWSHGYAYTVDDESGEVAWYPDRWSEENRPWVDARKRVGNIAIAGTDAGSDAMTEVAIAQAHRAVHSFA